MSTGGRQGSNPYDSLADDFAAELVAHAVAVAPAAQLDALASFMSSQLILFAGPSGTGKSTLARRLASFFSSRFAVLDGEPGLARRQELIGYASILSGTPQFASTEDAARLISLATPPGGSGAGDAPVLLVEEGNLSPSRATSAPSFTASPASPPGRSSGPCMTTRLASDDKAVETTFLPRSPSSPGHGSY